MCGIAGIIGTGAEKKDLEGMLQVAQRRGPEAACSAEVGNGVLGQTLLGFVDVGNNNQPLQEGRNVVAANFEIYNWQEINAKYDLGARNDTQVLLRGLQKKGPALLSEMDWQGAFVAQVEREGQLETLVGRDQWGICPLVFGYDDQGRLVLGSTSETVQKGGVKKVQTVPGGSYGKVVDGTLKLESWFELPRYDPKDPKPVDPQQILEKATQHVVGRIPDNRDILWTAMGGIDSQFITATVARATRGDFGGAVTVVPYDSKNRGDLDAALTAVKMLENEGIRIRHEVVPLTPDYVESALDRVLKVLGPDYFNACCGLAEDLVAHTVQKNGGKAVMTAGGPDEAGRSYKPWALLHRNDLEEGFYSVSDQFRTSEGVRAGLVLGEHGLENRVPLAFLIEEAARAPSYQKHEVLGWGDGKDPSSIQMRDKIFWREAIRAGNVLLEYCLNQSKNAIHSSTGAKEVLYALLQKDSQYQAAREHFVQETKRHQWNGIVHAPFDELDHSTASGDGAS